MQFVFNLCCNLTKRSSHTQEQFQQSSSLMREVYPILTVPLTLTSKSTKLYHCNTVSPGRNIRLAYLRIQHNIAVSSIIEEVRSKQVITAIYISRCKSQEAQGIYAILTARKKLDYLVEEGSYYREISTTQELIDRRQQAKGSLNINIVVKEQIIKQSVSLEGSLEDIVEETAISSYYCPQLTSNCIRQQQIT